MGGMVLNRAVRAPRRCVVRCGRCMTRRRRPICCSSNTGRSQRQPEIAASLRASQIRRANPALAAEIHAELTRR